MKNALVVGGSGLIGSQLIGLLLADEQYSVIALVRKPFDIKHKNFLQISVDFNHLDKQVVKADEIFCCLGSTIKAAGSKAAFYKVDYEFVLNIAQIAHSNGAKKFALVSSMGANKNSITFYSKTKGDIEEAVSCIGYESLFIFRPSMLLGKRTEFRLGEMIGKFLMTGLDFVIPKKYKAIRASQVAKAMIVSMNSFKTGLHILESDKIAEF